MTIQKQTCSEPTNDSTDDKPKAETANGSELTNDSRDGNSEVHLTQTKPAQIQKPTVDGSELTNASKLSDDSTNDSKDNLKVKTDS